MGGPPICSNGLNALVRMDLELDIFSMIYLTSRFCVSTREIIGEAHPCMRFEALNKMHGKL